MTFQRPRPRRRVRSRYLPQIASLIFVSLGLGLAVCGAWLIWLGGSWYYAFAAAGLVLTGGLLFAGRSDRADWIFAIVVLGTLGWSLYETGLDWWPLAARGDVILLLGVWLLLLVQPRAGNSRSKVMPTAIALGIAAIAGAISVVSDEWDLAGSMPTASPASTQDESPLAATDWSSYGRTNDGTRYSPLNDITPQNVGQLRVAWTYHSRDLPRAGDRNTWAFEVTPLKIGSHVYLCTPRDIAIALDAETGREIWRFEPNIKAPERQSLICRGVSYHGDAQPAQANRECSERILLPTADARLFALDAATGRPCAGFGENGAIDLSSGMPASSRNAGMYYSSSPPLVTRNLVVIGGTITDNYSTDEPSGVIRAYDAITGRLVWNWDAGNPDATAPIAPGEVYTHNSPNSWSVASADEALGLIYVPMGNQTPDPFGGFREPAAERFSSSIVALDIQTGQLRWVYQTVHHDLWDMDIPSQPTLIDLDLPAGRVPALVQPTKSGDIYVLDRRTGTLIVPAPEKPVPQGAAQGDHTTPTQPFSQLTFLPPPLKESDMWGVTMFDQLACRIAYRRLRYEGVFTPPSVQGSLVYPGNFGILNWGGIAVDPIRQIAFANPSYFAFYSRLVPRTSANGAVIGEDREGALAGNRMYGTPYTVDMGPLVSPLGLPCQAPPWGAVAGIDLRSARILYRHRNGTVRDRTVIPLSFKMGVPSLGGPIITASGIAFLTSSLDNYVRAYDVTTGKQLWQDRLPAGGQATPVTYRSPKGRQILLVAAGGHSALGTKIGDSIIAYALPEDVKPN